VYIFYDLLFKKVLAFGSRDKFACSWIRIRIFHADPDPEGKSFADPCGSGSETLVLNFNISASLKPNAKIL
jgi:hypothetical protein